MSPSGRRLDALEAQQTAHAARVGTSPRNALVVEALALTAALPDELRRIIEEAGARGLADMLAGAWEVEPGEDRRTLARRAYALAFEGDAP